MVSVVKWVNSTETFIFDDRTAKENNFPMCWLWLRAIFLCDFCVCTCSKCSAYTFSYMGLIWPEQYCLQQISSSSDRNNVYDQWNVFQSFSVTLLCEWNQHCYWVYTNCILQLEKSFFNSNKNLPQLFELVHATQKGVYSVVLPLQLSQSHCLWKGNVLTKCDIVRVMW